MTEPDTPSTPEIDIRITADGWSVALLLAGQTVDQCSWRLDAAGHRGESSRSGTFALRLAGTAHEAIGESLDDMSFALMDAAQSLRRAREHALDLA